MKSRNVKVVDEHNIDRIANIMFSIELDGSEYVVYWINRDEESNNIFVSKVLKNLDGTYNMLNIEEEDKKKYLSEIVKSLVSIAVSDNNDKLSGTEITLSNGKNVKIINVSFNKEQQINVVKTYITTVKKEVTKVAEKYYDVIIEEEVVMDIFPTIDPVVSTETSVEAPQEDSALLETFPILENSEVNTSVVTEESYSQPLVDVVEPIISEQEIAEMPSVKIVTPVDEVVVEKVAEEPFLETIIPTPVVESAPVVESIENNSLLIEEPIIPVANDNEVPNTDKTDDLIIPLNNESKPLVFNATKEVNLNAALGEVASITTMPVDNIDAVREFGVDTVVQTPVSQENIVNNISSNINEKAGFANSKFFMVVAVAFFLASCIFLGYEVYNYFQLVK